MNVKVMKHPGSEPLREPDFASGSVPTGTFNVNEAALDSECEERRLNRLHCCSYLICISMVAGTLCGRQGRVGSKPMSRAAVFSSRRSTTPASLLASFV